MAVHYLYSDLGVLTYFNDTALFNFVATLNNNDDYLIRGGVITAEGTRFRNNFPARSVYISCLTTSTFMPNPDGFTLLSQFFTNFSYKEWVANQTYEFYDNPSHYVKTKSRIQESPLYYNGTEIQARVKSSNYDGFAYGSAFTWSSQEPQSVQYDFSIIIFNDDYSNYYALGFHFTYSEQYQDLYFYKGSVQSSIQERAFYAFFNSATPSPDPPFPDTDPYAGIDGEGALPGDSELDLPPEPTTSPIDSGLFSLFSPSTSQMRALADYLWTDFGGVTDSIPQMLGEIVEALKRSVSNPLNSIFGLSIIASQGLPRGSSSSVHVGFWDTGISMTRISKQYFTVDCGSLSFQPVCGNTFLDYAPYSKFSIFLPYVGMRILDANDVVGHTISVKYRGDCVSGALVCFIKRDGQIIAEHSGNCALNLPLSADSWANTISSAARIALSGDVAPAMAGLSMGSASGAVKVAAAVATNPSALAPQVGQSGSVSGSSGHMGSQKPFILRETVRFHSTSHFNSVIGYPAFYFRKLGDCSGYTQVLDVHLHNTPCTGVELKEIEDLLKEGVII